VLEFERFASVARITLLMLHPAGIRVARQGTTALQKLSKEKS
jgi:hypothetical protein